MRNNRGGNFWRGEAHVDDGLIMNTAPNVPVHHPVFNRFKRWQGTVEPGFRVNCVGVLERTAFMPTFLVSNTTHTTPIQVVAELPVFNEEYFEWIELLEAVCESQSRFVMMELGAGFGRWLVTAALALRTLEKPVPKLIGVEAEATHFAWMSEHMRDNGLDPTEATLIRAAVGATDGQAMFMGGAPREWYGQAVLRPGQRPVKAIEGQAVEVTSVPQKSMRTLLADVERVDLLDMDIQGAELEVLKGAKDEMNRKVHRAFIATHHATIDAGMHEMFTEMGWKPRYLFPCMSTSDTDFGRIEFQDGVQAWHNPRLS